MPRREGWTLVDTARVMHGLMTEVLHYPKYAGQGGDWVRTLRFSKPDTLVCSRRCFRGAGLVHSAHYGQSIPRFLAIHAFQHVQSPDANEQQSG